MSYKSKKIILAFIFIIVLVLSVVVGSLPTNQYVSIALPILLAYLTVFAIRRMFFMIEAYVNKKKDNNIIPVKERPKVEIIVPCYNESKVIISTLENLSNLNYNNYSITVVDDGSSDDTVNVVIRFLEHYNKQHSKLPNITLLTKENGGKASALNYGIENSNSEYVLCVDADSCLHKNSIQEGLKYFKYSKVGAVAGFVTVANQNNLLTKLQEYEYLVGLNLVRRAMSNYGIVSVIPGPVGLFRREVLNSVGGFRADKNLMAEDAELSVRIVAAGWKIASSEGMISYTEAPSDPKSLIRQRYRWNRGMIQSVNLNLTDSLKSKYLRSKILMLNLVFEVYIVLLVNIAMVLMFITHFIFHKNIQFIDLWVLGILTSEAITAIFVSVQYKQPLKWISLAMFSQFIYNGIMMFWRMFSTADEIRSTNVSWDKLERKGIVSGKI